MTIYDEFVTFIPIHPIFHIGDCSMLVELPQKVVQVSVGLAKTLRALIESRSILASMSSLLLRKESCIKDVLSNPFPRDVFLARCQDCTFCQGFSALSA
jgi:hypothetical protein